MGGDWSRDSAVIEVIPFDHPGGQGRQMGGTDGCDTIIRGEGNGRADAEMVRLPATSKWAWRVSFSIHWVKMSGECKPSTAHRPAT